jgi:hypothetical protein
MYDSKRPLSAEDWSITPGGCQDKNPPSGNDSRSGSGFAWAHGIVWNDGPLSSSVSKSRQLPLLLQFLHAHDINTSISNTSLQEQTIYTWKTVVLTGHMMVPNNIHFKASETSITANTILKTKYRTPHLYSYRAAKKCIKHNISSTPSNAFNFNRLGNSMQST